MIYQIAALAQDFNLDASEIRLIPAGLFRANDGRPSGLPGWKLDAENATEIITDIASRDDLLIDFEHQSLKTKENGQPAPAAGWIKGLVWREGVGLIATGVKWTARARSMILAGEYRYISPVFSYSAVTGRVEKLFCAGLTNTPGLTGLTDLSSVAINARQAVILPRDSDHSIESFNRAFGGLGVFHPDTKR